MPEHPHVLVVDDDPGVRRAIERRVQRAIPGAHVLQVPTPNEALEVMASRRFDLVVSDFGMPAMDGVTMLAIMRREAPTTARVLLTGHDDSHIAERAVNEGAVHAYFVKPAVSEAFESKIRELVDPATAGKGAR